MLVAQKNVPHKKHCLMCVCQKVGMRWISREGERLQTFCERKIEDENVEKREYQPLANQGHREEQTEA